jgi:hypothetical protein
MGGNLIGGGGGLFSSLSLVGVPTSILPRVPVCSPSDLCWRGTSVLRDGSRETNRYTYSTAAASEYLRSAQSPPGSMRQKMTLLLREELFLCEPPGA